MLATKDLVDGRTYFVGKPSVVLSKERDGNDKINHLLLGDWLKYLGEEHLHQWKTKKGRSKSIQYVKVQCRGDKGWLKLDELVSERALEVNFVDVGQGDGCHIVTPDDDILLVDAGKFDNMDRFISWRYNLRSRNVKGAANFSKDKPEKEPWLINHVVMSHPDEDHYGGFADVFGNKNSSSIRYTTMVLLSGQRKRPSRVLNIRMTLVGHLQRTVKNIYLITLQVRQH